ncbi:hypothetical protein ACROYT_G014630 [Oculina patagonica]
MSSDAGDIRVLISTVALGMGVNCKQIYGALKETTLGLFLRQTIVCLVMAQADRQEWFLVKQKTLKKQAFGIPHRVVKSRVFDSTVCPGCNKLNDLFPFPSQDLRPCSLNMTHGQTTNTTTPERFQVGVTPNGQVSYLSDLWGGRVSRCCESSVLDLLEAGDNVMVDRGFLKSQDKFACTLVLKKVNPVTAICASAAPVETSPKKAMKNQ